MVKVHGLSDQYFDVIPKPQKLTEWIIVKVSHDSATHVEGVEIGERGPKSEVLKTPYMSRDKLILLLGVEMIRDGEGQA